MSKYLDAVVRRIIQKKVEEVSKIIRYSSNQNDWEEVGMDSVRKLQKEIKTLFKDFFGEDYIEKNFSLPEDYVYFLLYSPRTILTGTNNGDLILFNSEDACKSTRTHFEDFMSTYEEGDEETSTFDYGTLWLKIGAKYSHFSLCCDSSDSRYGFIHTQMNHYPYDYWEDSFSSFILNIKFYV